MKKTIAKSFRDQLRDVKEEYRESGEPWPATALEIARWGYNTGRLQAHSGSIVKQFAREIARALREDYYTDPQGRQVRSMHAAPGLIGGRQKMLWDDIRSAPPDHMEMALKLRRKQIVGDCQQLKTDQDSYNENNPHGANIQLSFNFERDLEEMATLEPPSVQQGRKPKPR